MKPIVCKFGGTSLATAEQVRKVEKIIRSNPNRRGIVVSAPGRRNPGDQKITDLLYACQQMASQGFSFSEPYQLIRDRFLELEKALNVKGLDMAGLLKKELQDRFAKGTTKDEAASRGEYLMGRLVAAHLGATFVDPFDGVIISNDGLPQPKTYDKMGKLLKGEGLFVVPGFYGQDGKGKIRTFSRGGSDITGAIVARAMDASLYENWTDTCGFLMCDPRIVPEAMPMPEVTYREIRELAYMGANVFHDEAIAPVADIGIPINIRNTNAPDDAGTLILKTRDFTALPIVGIAGMKGFTLFYVEKYFMNKERGIGRKLLEIFESADISYEITPTGIDSISVVVKDSELGDKTDFLVEEIRRSLKADRVEVVDKIALIATVGEGMWQKIGTAATLTTALAKERVNIRILDQGPHELNILVGVGEEDFEKAIRAIYWAFNS